MGSTVIPQFLLICKELNIPLKNFSMQPIEKKILQVGVLFNSTRRESWRVDPRRTFRPFFFFFLVEKNKTNKTNMEVIRKFSGRRASPASQVPFSLLILLSDSFF